HFVVEKIQNALNDRRKAINGSRIHLIGVAYKRNIDDVRESPALDVLHLLKRRGAMATYSDPHVPSIRMQDGGLCSADLPAALAAADCAVIITDHSAFDYEAIVRGAQLVVDTRNSLRGISSEKIIRL